MSDARSPVSIPLISSVGENERIVKTLFVNPEKLSRANVDRLKAKTRFKPCPCDLGLVEFALVMIPNKKRVKLTTYTDLVIRNCGLHDTCRFSTPCAFFSQSALLVSSDTFIQMKLNRKKAMKDKIYELLALFRRKN